MDEKVEGHRHKCLHDIDYCNVRGYHVCECGVRSSLREPQRWVSKKDAAANFIEGFLDALKEAMESPLDRVIRSINAVPQACAAREHYHAHHFSPAGLIHLCLKKHEDNEEKCAEQIAQIMIAAKLPDMDLIHVGNNEPAYHSSHVEMDDSPLMGVHIDPIRRN